MIIHQRLLITFFSIAILLVGLSCSDNSTAPETDTPGESSVEVSGTIEGDYSGWATFTEAELPFDMHSWRINMTDNNSFKLSLSIESTGSISRPEVGTYTIGQTIGSNASDFTAIFTDLASGGVGAGSDFEYSTVGSEETTGTLVIEESTENDVSGHFYFKGAGDIDENGNIIDPITTEGEFRAVDDESAN